MADQNKVGVISGMSPLAILTGDELLEVSSRQTDGTWKSFSIMVNKIRTNRGLSAYEVAVKNGYQGTELQWLATLNGKSAYDLAVDLGYTGTEPEWLTSLMGPSAYEVAVDAGYNGTQAEWLVSLVGKTAYQIAVSNGYTGTEAQWLVSLIGASAYEVAKDNGFVGTEAQWLKSLEGKSIYQIAVDNGFVGTEAEWLAQANSFAVDAKASADAAEASAAQTASDALATTAARNAAQSFSGSAQASAQQAVAARDSAVETIPVIEAIKEEAEEIATQAVATKDAIVILASAVDESVLAATSAKDGAVTAKEAAEAAALLSTEARDATVAVAESVEGAVAEAVSAKDAAEAVIPVVGAIKDEAVAAAASAVATKDAVALLAETVQIDAGEVTTSKNAAEAAALVATGARDAAEASAAQTASDVLAATAAKEATDLAVVAAQGSATQATTARDASEAFAANALTSVDDAQVRVLAAQLAASEASATEIRVTDIAETTAGYRDQSLEARDDAEANEITALAAAAAAQASKLLAQAAVPAAAEAAQVEVDAFKQLLVATGVTPGASVVTTIQAGDDAVSRFIQDKLLEQAISVDDFKLPAEGSNIRPALVRAIKAIKENKTKSRVLLIPFTVGEWTVDSQVLFDISDFTLLLHGNVRLTATTRQKTFLFSSDIINVPAVALKNVAVFGNGSYVNGNADQMTFTYAHGDGSDNDSAVRFSYIDNLRVFNVWGDNGPIDSFSTMRCRNQIIDGCKFTRAKEDNGFSATTDWGPVWEYGNFDTYSYGVVSNCTAEDNQDFGMTAYNASGIYFLNNRSQRNRAGYSYEDSYGAPDTKKYDGGFYGCWAWNCREQGFYIDADGITIDSKCKSWNIRYIGSNPNGLFGNGVVIANVNTARVEGEHTACGHAGLAIFNGTGNLIHVHAKGKFNDNEGPGIFGRGVSFLHIEPGTEVRNNGKVLVNALYNYGVNISNSGGANYLQGLGLVKVDGAIIGGNGLGGIDINYVNLVDIHNVIGVDNTQSGSGLGIRVQNATTARIFDNHMESVTGNQTFAVDIEATVQNGYEGGNTGTGTTGLVVNNATVKRQSMRAQLYGNFTYDAPSIAAGSQVAPTFAVLGAEVGDFVQVSFSTDIGLISVNAFVVTTGNVLVYLRNNTASAIDLPSMSVRVLVTKRNGG